MRNFGLQHWIPLLVFVLARSMATAVRRNAPVSSSRLRRLEDANGYFEWKISDFSVRFAKCQYVKTFDDELADDEDGDTVLAVKHFVLFNLCPTDECSTTCDSVHGEYVLDVYDYLDATMEFQKQKFEYMCENCNELCDDDGEYCDEQGCGKICYQYDNLENNGFVDASEYLECQKVDMQGNGDGEGQGDQDDNGEQMELYIGPRCTNDGSRIDIGLFSDENCWIPYDNLSVEDALGMELSYHIMDHLTSNDESVCISCEEQDDDNNANDQADADNVNEMCENLYFASAKCESPYGLENGFVQMNREENEYENQVENEFMACNFIDSLKWNSYTETGEINIYEEQDQVIRYTTPLQMGVLSGLLLIATSLIVYAIYLDRMIVSKYPPKVDLAAQTDHEIT